MAISETDWLKSLKGKGYTIEVVNPGAMDLRRKYAVYTTVQASGFPGGNKKLVVVDLDGNVQGAQG